MKTFKIIYPYNEILPKRTAHDVYVMHNCHSLANSQFSLQLLCGKGSEKDPNLLHHFSIEQKENFNVHRLPIIRRNNFLDLTWNRYFFHFCQQWIKREKPNFVLCSVHKQAYYHFFRKISGVKYLYEVHQLSWYPGQIEIPKYFSQERLLLNQADQIIVTTAALKQILLNPPYSIHKPIEVIPLAVNAEKIPHYMPSTEDFILKIAYVGQLYKGQGIECLLNAVQALDKWELVIVGGKSEEIKCYSQLAEKLGILSKIKFLGFQSPSEIPHLIADCHVFVAPFENQGRMPFVAHTKLLEYAHWGKPIVAPDLPIVREHFPLGVKTFISDNAQDLAQAFCALSNRALLERLTKEMECYQGKFSWQKRAEHYQKLLACLP